MSRILVMDCEMVGSGDQSILARVTIVDETRKVVLDEYVKPTVRVTDYRSCYSEVKKHHLENGSDFSVVRNKVANLINGCILMGDLLRFQLQALNLSHPESKRRDWADKFFIRNGEQLLAPKHLAIFQELMWEITSKMADHDSVEEAKTLLDLYHIFPKNW